MTTLSNIPSGTELDYLLNISEPGIYAKIIYKIENGKVRVIYSVD